jgi:hypothetical protein
MSVTRGAKPLPRYETETRKLLSRMERIGLGVEKAASMFSEYITGVGLRNKLKGRTGWNYDEIMELERIVSQEEQRIRKLAASL